jgi:hypothetical protein
MKKNIGTLLAIIASAFLIMLTYNSLAQEHKNHSHEPMSAKAICVLNPTEGNMTSGTVTFTQTKNGIKF